MLTTTNTYPYVNIVPEPLIEGVELEKIGLSERATANHVYDKLSNIMGDGDAADGVDDGITALAEYLVGQVVIHETGDDELNIRSLYCGLALGYLIGAETGYFKGALELADRLSSAGKEQAV